MRPKATAPFVDRVRATIKKYGLLIAPSASESPPPSVVVGVSGGADSVALLVALDEMARSDLPMALAVAHLHHGLRRESADADRAFVEELADRLGLVCVVGRADVPAEAEAQGIGLEEAARKVRRRFLRHVATQVGARKVALGHTADDRAETILFHILRGTGLEGLSALGPRSMLARPPSGGLDADGGIEIIRPLIDLARSDIRAFLESRGERWREDETNLSRRHARNRLRHDLLPLLREAFNPKVEEAILRLSDQAADAAEVLQDFLEETWRKIIQEMPDGRSLLVDAQDFAALRPWLQGAILRRAVERLGGGLKHMSAERTRAAVEAILSGSVAGPVDLPDGLVAQRRRRAIRIGKGNAE